MKTRTSHNTKYRFVRSNKQQPINKSNQSKSITSSKTSKKNRVKVSVCICLVVCSDVWQRATLSVFFAEIFLAGKAQYFYLSVLSASADLTPLIFRIRWPFSPKT